MERKGEQQREALGKEKEEEKGGKKPKRRLCRESDIHEYYKADNSYDSNNSWGAGGDGATFSTRYVVEELEEQ